MPNMPNGIDESNTPVTTRSGVVNPPDPTGSLLPNSTKYEISSNQWLAVPLDKGIYNFKSREEGQVVYIASTPDAKASLRVTKNFDIETVNRTAVYIKGQSVIDQLFTKLSAEIGQKRDISDSYNKQETEALANVLIQQAMTGFTTIMQFKGVLQDKAALDLIPDTDIEAGDVYQTADDGKFYIAKQDKTWEQMSGTIVDLTDYYNKAELDLLLAQKADAQTMEEYKNLVKNFIPPFTFEQTTDPSIDPRPTPKEVANEAALNAIDKTTVAEGQIYKRLDNNLYYALNDAKNAWIETQYEKWQDPSREGDTWFNLSNGIIYLRKTSQLDGNLFWLNSLENFLVINGNKWVTIDGAQTVTGAKQFVNIPAMTTDVMPTEARQFVTKGYIDQLGGIGGGAGQPIDTTNLAKLDAENTFTALNTFNVLPATNTLETINTLADNKLVTKGQVKEMQEHLFNSNPTIDNPKSWDDLANDELVTKADVITGGGGTGNAKLDLENHFKQTNIFEAPVDLRSDPVSGNDAVRLSFMQNSINTAIAGINTDFYDKTETDNLLASYVKRNDLASFMVFKGSLVGYDLLDTADKAVGNVYYVENPEDKRGFYIWNGTKWEYIGSGMAVDDKNYAKLDTLSSNTFNSNNTFNLTVNDPQVGTTQKTFKVGDMLTASNAVISFNNNKIQSNSTSFKVLQETVISPDNNLNVASFSSNGITFNTNPLLTTQKTIDNLLDSDLITKGQANQLIANAGQGGGAGQPIDTTNLAKLDAENTFTALNTFEVNPKVTNAKDWDTLSNEELTTKATIIEKIDAVRVISPTTPSGNHPIGTIWIKTSYTQDPNDTEVFTDIPAIYIKVSQNNWWDLHKEELI